MFQYSQLVRFLTVLCVAGAIVVLVTMMSSSAALKSSYHWSKQGSTAGQLTPEHVRALLATVKDSELDANIAELGLIYNVIVPQPGHAQVTMTLTTPACPYGRQIISDIQRVLLSDPSINDVQLRLVFDPAWTWDVVAKDVRDRILLRFRHVDGATSGEQR